MLTIGAFTTTALVALATAWLTAAPPSPGHDRAFWLSLAQNKFEVPANENAFDLLVETNELLASTDPVLRDEVAYGAAARWIYQARLLNPAQQKQIVDMWMRNLSQGIGERGTDSVFRRSFSALNLSIIAALDVEAPFLSQQEFDALLAGALDYLARERDTRGYDPAKGWIHTPAHTADLLKFLARNPRLSRRSQAAVLKGISAKCFDVGQTYAWGEDGRLAQVVRAIVRRSDLDPVAFESWLAVFPPERERLWAKAPSIDTALFPGVQNITAVLRATFVALSQDGDLTPAARDARQRILDVLAKL
jgi:hypothetical protein